MSRGSDAYKPTCVREDADGGGVWMEKVIVIDGKEVRVQD
jgi:hypothetical protein